MTDEHYTIDEVLLELEILKEKHGGHVETNIDSISWRNPSQPQDRPIVYLVNTNYRPV